MAITVTNANIDTAAALVDAPYGPLTRVTDVATLPVPNTRIALQFTSALGVTIWMTYEDLENEAVANKLAAQSHDWTTRVANLKVKIGALKTAADAMTAPHTYADYQALLVLLRGFKDIKGFGF
jgi:hypothetical protein